MRLFIILLISGFAVAGYAQAQRPSTQHKVYFEGSDHELHVYSIHGRRDGNTIFILGGIQGDEPGGHLSADAYSGLRLEQGNLIIIPRANYKSVILYNRGIDGDMNRLFVDNITITTIDEQVVKLITEYMGQADMFLNLHDGWGYHSSTYINEQRNPNRFGQSIIVDEDVYECDEDKHLQLQEMAQTVLDRVNARIPDNTHHLAYFNTQTGSPSSRFKDMQKTATWYALRNYCIPAFGIESSKNITSVELKVLYHNYAVNEFMALMDIIPENPPIYLAPAVLEEALITVNGEAVTVRNGDTVKIKKNDVVVVKHIETNHERGVTCDVLGYGNLNDLSRELTIEHSTKIVFRKENIKFAEVSLVVEKPEASLPIVISQNPDYVVELTIDNKIVPVAAGETVPLKIGTTFMINRILADGVDLNLPINLRGWVPPGSGANMADDRYYEIPVSPAAMLQRFSVENKGVKYPMTIERNGKEIARIYIELIE